MLTDSPLLWSGRASERAFSASALGGAIEFTRQFVRFVTDATEFS
jgi:hypothetical protein